MGSAMARVLFDLDRPTVGLLNIGVEEIKGGEEIREAGRMLRAMQSPQIEFIGFVEGDGIGKGAADVIVSEGFSGNIALKAAEGTARQIAEYLRGAMARTLASKIGYLFARGAFRSAARQDGSRTSPTAGCSSVSTASWSRAMVAPMPRALPTPSMLAMTWSATIS